MSQFLLSPGITPELTDLMVFLFPLSVTVGYLLHRTRGFPAAFAANALLLGALKLYTDYNDPYDVPVALAGLLAGLIWLGLLRRAKPPGLALGSLLVALGVIFVALGIFKASTDPLDPFDLLQSMTAVGAGLALAVEGSLRRQPLRGVTPAS